MLKNMVALVTGGAGALGSATAKKLVADGLKVVLLDLPSSKGQSVAEEIGPNALFSAGDIASEKDVGNALDLTKNKFGKLDVIVNCAGTFIANQLYSYNKEVILELNLIEEFIRTNLVGTLNVIRLGVPLIAENTADEDGLRGVVINTSGFAATDGQMGQVLTASVWGGISSMTIPLCRELGAFGIRVMTISPGLMDSKVMNVLPEKLVEYLTLVTPSPKRLGKPEEYACMVKSIIDNPFMNGEVIRLDGGLRFALS